MFFSLKAFVLFFFNNGGICVFCNLCFIAGNWNSVQVKSLTTHAPKQYCFYLWNINCYLIELPFYIFKNVLDKFISQTFTFFFYHKRAVNHTKKYTMTFLLIQEIKKAFYLSILIYQNTTLFHWFQYKVRKTIRTF